MFYFIRKVPEQLTKHISNDIILYMFRLKFNKGKQKLFFQTVKNITGFNWSELALLCKVNPRSMSDWHREKYLATLSVVENLCKVAKLPFPEEVKKVSAYWYTSKAGKIGWVKNYKNNGNPGTLQGRIKGGKKAVEINLKLSNGFVKRKSINEPNKSIILAELFGIILGDGHVGKYGFGVTLNKHTDYQYSRYVINIIKNLFSVNPKVFTRDNYIQIDTVAIRVIEFLLKNGLKRGSKIKNQVDVPLWIKNNFQYSIACMKGLVDTDGCIYFDKHTIKGVKYSSICLDFTNHSKPLLDFAKSLFQSLGYKANSSKWSVRLRTRKDVENYFTEVGFSNLKHKNKVSKFFSNGEVA